MKQFQRFQVGDTVSIPTGNDNHPRLRRKIIRIHEYEDEQCLYWRKGDYEKAQSYVSCMWVNSDYGEQIRLIKTKCPTNDMPDTRAYLEAVAHDH